jgi:hypothetical protein
MNIFIQTLTELFLDRGEFLRMYSPLNKNVKFIEFFSILLGSISLSISAILVNPPYSSGYIALIALLALGNYFFLSLLSSFLSYSIDLKAKSLIKSGDFPSLVSSARSLNIIYIFSCPIAVVFSFFGIPSFSAFCGILLFTVSSYIWIFSSYANDIYGMGAFKTFRNSISSIFFILCIPFTILFYFLMNLSVII